MTFTDALLLVALGLIPSLIWLSLFLKEDRHPEPKTLVTKTFLMGIIIAPIAVLMQAGFSRIDTELNYFIAGSSLFFLWAAFVEEILKFFAVRTTALTDPQFDEPVDAMIYMITAGLGFAAIENILVLFRTIPNGLEAALTVWTLRFVGATLLHALAASITGYFLALSWFFRDHRYKLLVLGLSISTLFHFAFNIMLANNDNQVRGLVMATGLLCVMAFLVFVLFDKIKKRSKATPNFSAVVEKSIAAA